MTTRPHRDGGPDECLLLLGYEPSSVPAELRMADYSRCAHGLGLTPGEEMAVVKSVPFGDPLVVVVRGMRLALRRREASWIRVE